MNKWIIERKMKLQWKINPECLILVKIYIFQEDKKSKKENRRENVLEEITIFLRPKKKIKVLRPKHLTSWWPHVISEH